MIKEEQKVLSENQIEEYYKTQSSASNPISPTEFATRNPIIISPEKAEGKIDKANETKVGLTPEVDTTKTDTTKQTQTNQLTGEKREINPLTLLNDVGQEVTFNNPDVNFQNIQSYINKGYEVKEGSLPSGIVIGGESDPTTDLINKQNKDVEDASIEIENLTNKLNNLDISKDPSFVAITQGIQNTWNDRIREMEQANRSRQANLTQLGIRYGSKYTGGSFGTIVAEEERQGMQRVASFESQKLAALASAEVAFRSQKFDEYVKMIDLAEEKYNREVEELNTLNQVAIDRNKAIAEENKAQRETDKFEMDRVENVLENISESVFNAMTGDEEVDMQTINDMAVQYDIDPNYLISSLVAKQGEEEERIADIEAVKALTKSREASAEKSLRVSDASTKIDDLDKAMSPNELRITRDDYGLSVEELPPGSTLRDAQIKQAEKFAEANKEEDPKEVVKAITENTDLDEEEAKGIFAKIVSGVVAGAKKLFGGGKKEDDKTDMTEIDDILNSF